MALLAADINSSIVTAVGASSAQSTAALAPTDTWLFGTNADCWIAQGANPTATAGSGSVFVKAGTILPIDGKGGAKVAVIQDGAATGKSWLARAVTK